MLKKAWFGFLTFLLEYTLASTSFECVQTIAKTSNDNLTCKICNGKLYLNNSPNEKELSLEELRCDADEVMKKYCLIVCRANITHIFHFTCIFFDERSKNSCIFCGEPFKSKSIEYLTVFMWLNFYTFPPIYQRMLFKTFNSLNLGNLIKIFNKLNNQGQGNKLAELKNAVSKHYGFENVTRMIEIYEYESNDLCFASRVVTQKSIVHFLEILSEEKIRELLSFQLIRILINISKNQDRTLANELTDKLLVVIYSIPKFKISAFLSDIFAIIDLHSINPLIFDLLETFLVTDFTVRKLIILVDKCLKSPFLTVNQYSLIFRCAISNSEIADCNTVKSVFDFFKEQFCIIPTETSLKVLDALFLYNTYDKFSIEYYLFKFLIEVSEYEIIAQRKSFLNFIAIQVNNSSYSNKVVYALTRIIFISPQLKYSFLNFLAETTLCYIDLSCSILNFMLLSPEKAQYQEYIDKFLENLSGDYSSTIAVMTRINLKAALEVYMNECFKNKERCIRNMLDISNTLEAINQNPEFSYLSYFLLDIADMNLTKSDINLNMIKSVYTKIFENVNIEDPASLDQIFDSFYNTLFYIFYIPDFLISCYKSKIPADLVLTKLNLKMKISQASYNNFLLNSIFTCSCNVSERSHLDYFKAVFLPEKDSILEYLKVGKLLIKLPVLIKITEFFLEDESDVEASNSIKNMIYSI